MITAAAWRILRATPEIPKALKEVNQCPTRSRSA
jgi:hypothetical protein